MLAAKTKQKLGKLAPALDLVDDRFGPIKSLVGVKQAGPGAGWWIFHSALTRPLGHYFSAQEFDAWGSSLDPDAALFKCLGESLERYCAFADPLEERVNLLPANTSPYFDKLPRCSGQENCSDYFKQFNSDWLVSHVAVKELVHLKESWLPATYVHLFFPTDHSEPVLTRGHSTGTAFHETLESAIWSGLTEVAERDAVALMWLNQYPASEIILDLRDCPFELSDRLKRIDKAGLKARFFDITTEFQVPTVFAIVEGEQYPYRTVAAACDTDCIRALTKPIDEIMMVRSAQLSGRESVNVQSYETFEWVHSLRDHSDLYATWADTPAFDFLDKKNTLGMSSTQAMSISKFMERDWWAAPSNFEDIQNIAKTMRAKLGMNVLYADITLEDVSQFGHCVKVIVPEMQPLSVEESAKWLGTKRIVQHAQKHGLEVNSNPYPHPFP